MEPFGLFQFLQSLLSAPPSTQDSAPPAVPQNAEESPQANVPPPPMEPKNNDAYMQFISAHESRVKKTRK